MTNTLFLATIILLASAHPLNSVYTTFSVYYPDANTGGAKIYLRGDNCGLNWSKGVVMNQTGINSWTTAMLCPDNVIVNVKVLLNDSVWMFGKNEVFTSTKTKEVVIYPSFKPKANPIIDTANIYSSILGNSRKCSIYFPPSYYDNTLKKYELLIMHDGQNLFDNKKAAFGTAWLIQDTLNTLAAEGKIRQIVVVGVWNTNDRNNEYTYSYDASQKFGGKGDKYLDFLQKELLTVVLNDWLKGRVILGSYSIGGSSLGGLISCYAVYTRYTVFNKAICMSSSFWWNSEDFNKKIISTQKFYENVYFYLDSGDSGPSQDGVNQTITVSNHFARIGYKLNQNLFYYLDKGGQHSESYWGKRFHVPLENLYS